MTFQEKFGNFLAKLRWISPTRSQSFSTSHLCRTIGTLLLGAHAIWTLFQGSSLLLWQSSFQFFQWRPWYRYVCASLFVQNKCASYPVAGMILLKHVTQKQVLWIQHLQTEVHDPNSCVGLQHQCWKAPSQVRWKNAGIILVNTWAIYGHWGRSEDIGCSTSMQWVLWH